MNSPGSGQGSTRLSLLAVAVLAVLVVGLVLMNRRQSTEPVTPTQPGQSTPGTTATVRAPSVPPPPAIALTPTPTISPVTGRELPFGNPPPPSVEKKKWKADDIVAVVNGRAIRVGDLSLLGMKDGVIELDAIELQNYLEAELKRELVMQEATKQGLKLDDKQQWRLDQVREKYAAMQPLNDAAQRQMESELRLLEVEMKLNRLLAAQGVQSPTRAPSNAEIEAYYRAHLDVYGAMPEDEARAAVAWRTVREQIRQRLVEQNHIEFGKIKDVYLSGLKSNATVEIKNL